MSVIDFKLEAFYDGASVQGLPSFKYGEVGSPTEVPNLLTDCIEIPASSTNLVIDMPTIANLKITKILDPEASGNLSLKLNGDTVAFTLANDLIFSEAITSLSVTNASTTTARKIVLQHITLQNL
jgi:hypothetical protein